MKRFYPLKEYKALCQEFNKSAKALKKAFPIELENMLIVSEKDTLYTSPEIKNLLSEDKERVERIIQKFSDFMPKLDADAFAYPNYDFQDTNIRILALNTQVYERTPRESETFSYMDKIWLFDHEIGHLVVEKGFSASPFQAHLAECCADAFATIRHIQRFGLDTELLECAKEESSAIIFGISQEHYTSTVIQAVARLAEKKNLSKLSLEATARLAYEIAEKYKFSNTTLNKLTENYYTVGVKYKCRANFIDPENRRRWSDLSDGEKIPVIKECLQTILDEIEDHDTYRAGKILLDSKDTKRILEEERKNDSELDRNLKKLEVFEKESDVVLSLVEAMNAEKGYIEEPPRKKKFPFFGRG